MATRKSAWALLAALPIFIYAVYPLGAMLSESLSLPVADFRARQMHWDSANQPAAAGIRHVLQDSKTHEALWGTLKLSALSALFAGAWGLALALLWTRREFRGRRFFSALGYTPILMPPIVGTLAFDALAGETGALWRMLPGTKVLITPFIRVLLVHIYSFGCYTYAYVAAALQDADASREDAARGLGAGRVKTFLAATWPVIRAPLLAAALLTFMASAASFSAPYMLDNSSRYLTVEIFNERGDPGEQRALSVLLAGLSLAALPAFLLFFRDAPLSGAKGEGRRGLPLARAKSSNVYWVLSIAAGVLLLLPPLEAVLGAWTAHGNSAESGGMIAAFQKLTAEDWASLGRSFYYGAAAAAINIVLAPCIAVALKKAHGLAALPAEFGVMLALALPGSAVAVALLSAFNGPSWAFFGAALGGGPSILILAYAIRTLALVVRPARAAFEAIGDDVVEAASILGARRGRVFFKVILPMLAPSLIAGGLLCFITAAGEYVASMLLFSPETMPVSVRIDQLWRTDARAAHALALCLMAACGLLALAAQFAGSMRWQSRRGNGEL